MESRSSIKLRNRARRPLTIVIEPWAGQWELAPGSECEVFSVGGEAPPRIDLAWLDESCVAFYIETAGAIYEYWVDGVLID